jgi:hypothetical protein
VAAVLELWAAGRAAGRLLPQLRGDGGDMMRLSGLLLAVAASVLLGLAALAPVGAVATTDDSPLPTGATRVPLTVPGADAKPPVFAYYYIWFSQGSWDRAKTDLPQLGTYSSADPKVIAQHISWARQAGIDGFIVSWKHEARLDVPLQRLVAEAQRQQFKLILLYQGLDFHREPIDAERVLDDLSWFSRTYGSNPVFDVFGRPAVIWSGTWRFTPDEIGMVRAGLGAPDSLLLLGSERSAADYEARRELFDGDAYYWSSADPTRTPGYEKRIDDLGDVVAADGGEWIAPINPGFDARLIGGTSVVERRGGDTYRAAWAAAARSDPSAMGIISWNEFSENSHIEPSAAHGPLYLDLTRQLSGAAGNGSFALPTASPRPTAADRNPVLGPVDSSDLPIDARGRQQILSLISGLALLIGLGVVIYRMRARTSRSSR